MIKTIYKFQFFTGSNITMLGLSDCSDGWVFSLSHNLYFKWYLQISNWCASDMGLFANKSEFSSKVRRDFYLLHVKLLMRGPASNFEACCASENENRINILLFSSLPQKRQWNKTPNIFSPSSLEWWYIFLAPLQCSSSFLPSCHRYESNL